jgi:hypothetical protein
MKTVGPEQDVARVNPRRGAIRASLVATLLAVAAVYAWYCMPLGATLTNVAVTALLAGGAAACAGLSALASARRRNRPRTDPDPTRAVELNSPA